MKTIMMAGLALATFTAPALAQTTAGTMQTPAAPMQTVPTGEGHGTSADGTMTTMAPGAAMAPKMTKSQMTKMRRCQAMAPDAMAKSMSCQKMAKMHPEMATPSAM